MTRDSSGRIRSLAFIAVLFAGCSPAKPPEGGSNIQIVPDVHNLFRDAKLYITPRWKEQVEDAATAVPDSADAIRPLASQPVALWIDRAEPARTEVAKWIDDAGTGLVVVVIHDLPNRDCSRAASGEFALGDEQRYRTEVIDSVAASIATRDSHRVAIILEPNSLANLVAFANVEECAASDSVYRRSIAYAISKLSMSGVQIYLDAGNAALLGSDERRDKIAALYKDVLDHAGGADKIRGFATNVGGYSAVGDEIRYINKLEVNLVSVGILDKFFVVDTSRNGRGGAFRKNPTSWCNVRGAGLGERPRSSPAPGIDAYFWIKNPAESDGTSNSYTQHFDATCASPDATLHAPEAGQLFPAYLADLVRLANPPLRPDP